MSILSILLKFSVYLCQLFPVGHRGSLTSKQLFIIIIIYNKKILVIILVNKMV